MPHALTYVLSVCLLAAPPAAKQQDALRSIEQTRGGRHWIDEKTPPPKSPEESRKSFQIEPGLAIELFAAEPLVMDPVAITFDERGRMFVVEYGDYPIGPPKGKPPLSRVVLLEDTNGDGRADRRTLFADRLSFAHSLMAYHGGILLAAQSEIIFLKDTTGDNRADVRQVLFKGFQAAHPQMQIGNPRSGMDNWIYLNYGPGQITSSQSPEKKTSMPRSEFRFHPLTMEFGPASGLGQFGNTIDNWGRRFFCTNRNPIMTAMLPWDVWKRNPFVVIPKAHIDVGPSGGAARVYPLVKMKSNYLSHAGTYTAACGTTAYRGDLLGKTFQESLFVCEPIGHLVTRSILTSQGTTLTAQRARPQADFLASTDTWFRPASLASGPDGALYLADMYRLWVEHPKFLPDDIAKKLDWRAGDDRGRIWRIVPQGSSPLKFQKPKTMADRIALLSDANGWRRSLGQRLLVEGQEKAAAPKLAELLNHGERPLTRLHALWTLDGLGQLTAEHIITALGDANAGVRSNAVTLAGRRLGQHPALLTHLTKLTADADIQVRYQLAIALGTTDDPLATRLLTTLALRDGNDRWFSTAVLTSTQKRSAAVLVGLVGDRQFVATGSAAHISLVRQLAAVVGARGDQDELAALLDTLGKTGASEAWWPAATLTGLASGLPRHNGSLGRTSLAKLLAHPPPRFAAAVKQLLPLIDKIQKVAAGGEQTIGDRIAAIEFLAYQPFDKTSGVFNQLLATDQPIQIQLACLASMSGNGSPRAAAIVLERWPTLGPKVRGPALTLLLRRVDSTRHLLTAMADGKVNPAVIGVDQRVRLLKHRDASIRGMALKLLGGAVSEDRRQVAEQYRSALAIKATAAEGKKVFERSCAKCHRIGKIGHEVGPDLSDTRNRSREALLYDILDPNRKLEPQFTNYTVLTDDGQVFNGLLVSEEADTVILRGAEGKLQVIPRASIDQLRGSGISLMPEGVEKEITVRQMADLLEFLKSNGQK